MKRLHSTIRLLLVTAIGLPIVYLGLHLVAGLLTAMEDDRGAAVVRGVATASAIAWPIVLVGLLVAVAYDLLQNEPPDERP